MSDEIISFKKVVPKAPKPNDPESLFRNLRDRDSEIRGLWSHQADILREYDGNHLDSKDVALQLPTGAGKTLIGLLIGEYRRLKDSMRVIYLCPTKQLVHQVNSYAEKYGIKAHAFVGKQSEYSTKDFNEYINSDAIAITTYSALFNINPRFDNANLIICDDAHGSESYISSMWSLKISFGHELFSKIVGLFEDNLPTIFVNQIRTRSQADINPIIEKVPNHIFLERLVQLSELLEANITSDERSLYYSWRIIQKNLFACNLFISRNEILIKPWVPPTLTHGPFNNSSQRIYMSATLGTGGELERILGIPKIERLSIPPGWDKQGSGRRFFVFPDYNYSIHEYLDFIVKNINKRSRSLILCPNRDIVDLIQTQLQFHGVNHQFFDSNSIEESLESFTSAEGAVLVLANRYDGLDLPEDTCRQLFIVGLPGATNIQEGFLFSRLGISSLLTDRIVTRFTQASGRCTRGSTDYSLVIPMGSELFEFCLAKDNNEKFHPELQAELIFGLEQSKDSDLNKLDGLINLFMEQGEIWKGVEENIVNLRDETDQIEDSKSSALSNVVKNEINFAYEFWNKNSDKAIEQATTIIDSLSGSEFDGYRALWNYFAGSVALFSFKNTGDKHWENLSFEYFKRAKTCANLISWFSELPSNSTCVDEVDDNTESWTGYSIENILDVLHKLRLTGPRFELKMKEYEEQIKEDESSSFELGITYLGELLGFKSFHPGKGSSPDSVWKLDDKVLILFEAKSEEGEEGVISIDTCRQSYGHYNWAKDNIKDYDLIQKKICVVISKRDILDAEALSHSEGLSYIHIDDIRELFSVISGILRRIRTQTGTYNKESIRSKLLTELESSKLTPEELIATFENVPLSSMTK